MNYPTNRQRQQHATKKKFWCMGCDRALVGKGQRCPVCGCKPYRKKNKRLPVQ